MNRIFLVRIRGSDLLFSEEKFWNFCSKCKHHNWVFSFGDIDSNEPLKSPKEISIKNFKKIFDLEKAKPLLKYKMTKYGSNIVTDMPFFTKEVYLKFGERIGWNDTY